MNTVVLEESVPLVGKVLGGIWKVTGKLPDPPANPNGNPQSVGQFSRTYFVEGNGTRAFLKAIDLSVVMEGADDISILQATLNQYVFEKTILELCRDRNFDRVVKILDAGEFRDGVGRQTIRIPYLIFELADRDARQLVRPDDAPQVAWALRLLHHVAVGLSQLHRAGIAHQDIKLSNVFDFGGRGLKVGDVGRAIPRLNDLASICPHIDCVLAGDRTYAPPELLYNAPPIEWERHRYGADVYMLGSLIPALFLGANLTAMVQANLADEHRAFGGAGCSARWGGVYQELLPYLRSAFEKVMLQLDKVLRALDSTLRNDICLLVRQLCDPDPRLRGDPASVVLQRGHDLERVVSRLDLLARRAEIAERIAKK